MAASKQKSLSIKDKVRILKSVEASAGQHGSKGRIAREFGIANSTLYLQLNKFRLIHINGLTTGIIIIIIIQ